MILPQRNQKKLNTKAFIDKNIHLLDPIIIITEKTEPFSLPPPQDFSEKKLNKYTKNWLCFHIISPLSLFILSFPK